MSQIPNFSNVDLGVVEPQAADRLMALVYGELRGLAARKMASLAAGQTLQPTALVHEAWIRLVGDDEPRFENRRHFFAVAAEAMRHILIDDARKKSAQRRGKGQRPLNLDEFDLAAPSGSEELLELDEALEKLTRERPLEAELVKLRYFVGMTIEQAAEALGISERTAKRYWTFARAWLHEEIKAQQGR